MSSNGHRRSTTGHSQSSGGSHPSRVPNTAGEQMDFEDEFRLPSLPARSQTEAPSVTNPPDILWQDPVGLDDVIDKISEDLTRDINKCNTVGSLVRLVPVPAQPNAKVILEDVFTACQKKGSAELLLKQWRNKLASSAYGDVSNLNSLRAPVVQVCKEAQGPDDGGLSSMDFTSVILDAKKAALTRMISIKELEYSNLVSFTSRLTVERKLFACWASAMEGPHLTPEHQGILRDEQILKRFAQVISSIGDSAYLKVTNNRQRQEDMRKEAVKNSTNLPSGDGQRDMMSLVNEALSRREQSRRDKNKTRKGKSKPGNGNGGAGPSKKQNQPKGKKTVGVRKARGRNGPPSKGKQPKKR